MKGGTLRSSGIGDLILDGLVRGFPQKGQHNPQVGATAAPDHSHRRAGSSSLTGTFPAKSRNTHTPQHGQAQTRRLGAWMWVGVEVPGAVRCRRWPRGALRGPTLKPERGRARSEGARQFLLLLSPRPPTPASRLHRPPEPQSSDLARRPGARSMRPPSTPSPGTGPQTRT